MLSIRILCVGKMKERFYIDAASEYVKRLKRFCQLEIIELTEEKLPQDPTDGEIAAALKKEAETIATRIPKGAAVVAMCIEGKHMSSEEFADCLTAYANSGISRICVIIGGSYGMDSSIKQSADLRLSMSKMTFPHHLARVMVLEQIYRGFSLIEGSKYHK